MCCGWPNSVIVPESGRMMSRIMRMVVVLPAPLGPSRPYTDPARHLERQVAHRDVLLVPLHDIANVDREVRHGWRKGGRGEGEDCRRT